MGEPPLLWRLQNLAELLNHAPPETREAVERAYKRAGHPPIEHVSLNGKTLHLGQGDERWRVIAEGIPPLQHVMWMPTPPLIEYASQDRREPSAGEAHYSPHPTALNPYPLLVPRPGSPLEHALLLRKSRGMGPGGALDREAPHSGVREKAVVKPHPLTRFFAELGEIRRAWSMDSATLAEFKESVLASWVRGPGEEYSPLSISTSHVAQGGLGRLTLEAEHRLYNPPLIILQPYALARSTLTVGEEASSNLVILGVGNRWIALVSKHPVRLVNEGGTVQAYYRPPLLLLGPESQPPLRALAYWSHLATPSPRFQCVGPLITGGDPRVIVASSKWQQRRDGEEWRLELVLSNPTWEEAFVRLRVEPPFFAHAAEAGGVELILEDASSLSVFLASFSTETLRVRLKRSRLALLARGRENSVNPR